MNPEYYKLGDAVLKGLRIGERKIDAIASMGDNVGDGPFVTRGLRELVTFGYVEYTTDFGAWINYGNDRNSSMHARIKLTDKGASASRSSLEEFENATSLKEQREIDMVEYSRRSTIAAEKSAASADRANRIAWVAIWVSAAASLAAALAWILPRS